MLPNANAPSFRSFHEVSRHSSVCTRPIWTISWKIFLKLEKFFDERRSKLTRCWARRGEIEFLLKKTRETFIQIRRRRNASRWWRCSSGTDYRRSTAETRSETARHSSQSKSSPSVVSPYERSILGGGNQLKTGRCSDTTSSEHPFSIVLRNGRRTFLFVRFFSSQFIVPFLLLLVEVPEEHRNQTLQVPTVTFTSADATTSRIQTLRQKLFSTPLQYDEPTDVPPRSSRFSFQKSSISDATSRRREWCFSTSSFAHIGNQRHFTVGWRWGCCLSALCLSGCFENAGRRRERRSFIYTNNDRINLEDERTNANKEKMERLNVRFNGGTDVGVIFSNYQSINGIPFPS